MDLADMGIVPYDRMNEGQLRVALKSERHRHIFLHKLIYDEKSVWVDNFPLVMVTRKPCTPTFYDESLRESRLKIEKLHGLLQQKVAKFKNL